MSGLSVPRDAPAGWCVGGPCKFSRARRAGWRVAYNTHSFEILLLLLLSFITTAAAPVVAAASNRSRIAFLPPRTRVSSCGQVVLPYHCLSVFLYLYFYVYVCLCVCNYYKNIIIISFACQRLLTKNNNNTRDIILCAAGKNH